MNQGPFPIKSEKSVLDRIIVLFLLRFSFKKSVDEPKAYISFAFDANEAVCKKGARRPGCGSGQIARRQSIKCRCREPRRLLPVFLPALLPRRCY